MKKKKKKQKQKKRLWLDRSSGLILTIWRVEEGAGGLEEEEGGSKTSCNYCYGREMWKEEMVSRPLRFR